MEEDLKIFSHWNQPNIEYRRLTHSCQHCYIRWNIIQIKSKSPQHFLFLFGKINIFVILAAHGHLMLFPLTFTQNSNTKLLFCMQIFALIRPRSDLCLALQFFWCFLAKIQGVIICQGWPLCHFFSAGPQYNSRSICLIYKRSPRPYLE